MNIRNLKPLVAAIGTALAASMPAFAANDASENPFALDELRDGYHLFAKGHGEGDGEGDCSTDGEGHCSGEGNCSGDGEKDKDDSGHDEA